MLILSQELLDLIHKWMSKRLPMRLSVAVCCIGRPREFLKVVVVGDAFITLELSIIKVVPHFGVVVDAPPSWPPVVAILRLVKLCELLSVLFEGYSYLREEAGPILSVIFLAHIFPSLDRSSLDRSIPFVRELFALAEVFISSPDAVVEHAVLGEAVGRLSCGLAIGKIPIVVLLAGFPRKAGAIHCIVGILWDLFGRVLVAVSIELESFVGAGLPCAIGEQRLIIEGVGAHFLPVDPRPSSGVIAFHVVRGLPGFVDPAAGRYRDSKGRSSDLELHC